MLDQMLKHINENNLAHANSKILLAVSGGADSVVMTHLMIKAGFGVGIAHCNFQLRAMESDDDQHFVQLMAMELGCPYYTVNFETRSYADAQKISVQMAARKLRYEWFQALMKKNGYDCVATAHHLDDTTETFFINLMRGSGPEGLTGIPVAASGVIRPLLFARRQEIEDYARKHQLAFRSDSSNSEEKYLRNSIRQKLMPLIASLKPGSVEGIQQSIQYLHGNQELMKHLLSDYLKRFTRRDKDVFLISKTAFSKNNASMTLLFECLKPFGFKGDVIQNIFDSLYNQPGALFLSSEYRLSIGRNDIEISSIILSDESREAIILPTTNSISEPVVLQMRCETIEDDFQLQVNPEIAQLDFDQLRFPMIVRKVKEGDRFRPLGMKGSKLLSDFFIDQKFSDYHKRNTFVLVNADGEIAWIVGRRIGHRFRITSATKKIYILGLHTEPDSPLHER